MIEYPAPDPHLISGTISIAVATAAYLIYYFTITSENLINRLTYTSGNKAGSVRKVLCQRLLGGVLFVLLFLEHGALWLGIKTDGALQARATRVAAMVWPVLVVAAVTFLAASWFQTDLYANYLAHPVLFAVIAVTVLALLTVRVFIARQAWFKAWFASSLTIVGAIFYGVIGLFPNLFPSSLDPAFNLTARNASSSPLTLQIMLVVVIVFVPIVIAYQTWSYNLFKHKVAPADLAHDETY